MSWRWLAAALAVGCSKLGEAPATATLVSEAGGLAIDTDAPQWKYVELKVAEERPPLTPLPAPGRIDFDEKRTANVGSPLSGRVESVEVRLGDAVKRGDRLFSVRSGAFADLEREVDGARADVAVKERVVQRVRELFALKASPEKDLLAAEAELKAASLALKAAVAKRQSLKVGSGGDNLFWVSAPRAGTIVDVDVYAGQEVTPDRDKSLVRISDLDEVLVIADVPETDLGDLKLGGAVTVRVLGRSVERASTVSFISEVVDPRRRTVEVRSRLSNEDRTLRPNSFVEVVPTPDPALRRVRVADTAVVTDGAKSVVFVARQGGRRLEPVAVHPGRRRDGEVELLSGLEPGTRYVARGALLLLNQLEL